MVPADAQTVSCTPTSPQCCWVALSWQKMGGTTSISSSHLSTSATACCYYLGSTIQNSGIPGVYCSPIRDVTTLIWNDQSLQGSIPTELSNLKNLTQM